MLAIQKNKDIIQQIAKLTDRIDSLSETNSKLFQYLSKIQTVYCTNTKIIKKQVEKFEDVINKKSLYSIGKVHNMKKYINILKHMLTFIEGVAKVNQNQLQKIDIVNSKKQSSLRNKAKHFTQLVSQYNLAEQNYNKNFIAYQQLCGKLDQMVGKFRSFENPIHFYNIHMASDFAKGLDKKYEQFENKETSLTSILNSLDEKRKLLTQILKDIKQNYVVLINTHMSNIKNAAGCLTDTSKDDLHTISSTISIQKAEGDLFNEEIQVFQTKYGKSNAQQDELILSDFKDFFANDNTHISITTDQKLFLDRCQTFSKKKCESVQEFLYLQKKFVEQVRNQIENCQKINKQFNVVQKNIFRSNGTEDFKKKMRKYFGDGILNITQLCFIMVDAPRRRFQKISKILQSHEEKLKKILQNKQEFLKNFKKRINIILSQFNNSAEKVKNDVVSISKYKGNIQRTFSIFKNLFEQFTRNQNETDKNFQDIIKKVNSFTQRQSAHCLLKYTLSKQKENFLYNIYKKFNADIQIVQIVKQDTRYQVLFNEPLRPCLHQQFKSLLDKKKVTQTRNILRKKQYQSKEMLGQKQIGCCGISNSRIRKYIKITDHNAVLFYDNDQSKSGVLQILNKGITFQEKKKNPFSQKIQLVIPTKQIISYANKNSQQGNSGIQIMTSMGAIFFISEQIKEIQNSIQKNLAAKINSKNQNDSKKDKSNDSSSFMKQNNTSTQYKISFQKSNIINENKNNSFRGYLPQKKQNSQMSLIKKYKDAWKKQKYLSESLVVQTSYQSGDSIRSDYHFRDEFNKFILKQRRSFKINSSNSNCLNLIYEWKVSFPDMPMLKSFRHGEEVKIQLTQAIVKIIITQNNRGENNLFVRKTFYNEIQKMNKKLSDCIVEAFQREGQVIINQEQPDEQSTIVLDTENLAIDKDQIQNKREKNGLKKMMSGISAVQSQKSTIKGQTLSDF